MIPLYEMCPHTVENRSAFNSEPFADGGDSVEQIEWPGIGPTSAPGMVIEAVSNVIPAQVHVALTHMAAAVQRSKLGNVGVMEVGVIAWGRDNVSVDHMPYLRREAEEAQLMRA